MDNGIRESFDLYRKWFQTLLVKEFFNLPVKYQERFIVLVQKFLDDCKRVHEEAKNVKERPLTVIVEKVLAPDNKEEKYIICGHAKDVAEEIRINYPNIPDKKDVIKVGSKFYYTTYSLNGSVWYSTKTDLLKDQGN